MICRKHSWSWAMIRVLLGCWLSVTAISGIFAQDDSDESSSLIRVPSLGVKPLAVVTLSSIEQAQQKLRALFEIAGHPETIEGVIEQFYERTDGLAGFDQTRPAGVAIFLDRLIPPSFEFVVFAPLSDVDTFMRTLELGPVIANPVTGESGRYELIGPGQTSQVRIENGYAFIQLSIMEPDEEFARGLPEPAALVKGLTGQFDLSVSLDVDSIPKPTRDLIINFITATMSTQMQQRDSEADGLYEMRRSWMQADIDGFKLLMDECQRMSLGISVNPELRVADVDFLIDVREDSKLLNEILESTTKPSYFSPILDDNAAISVSMSSILPQRDRDRYVGTLDGFKKELARQVDINNLGPELEDGSPVLAALTSLQETFQKGHLDAFGQCYLDSEGRLVVVGAGRVVDGELIALGLQDMLSRIEGQDWTDNLQLGVSEHAGIRFHRIGFGNTDPRLNAVLGSDSGVIFGCGPRSIWFGLGGEETVDTVAAVMDHLQLAYEQPSRQFPSATVRFIINVASLIQLIESAESNAAGTQAEEEEEIIAAEAGGDRRRRPFRERQEERETVWRETLAEGGDRIRMELHPTKHGSRFRMEFGEAFLKGMGRAIAVTLPDED